MGKYDNNNISINTGKEGANDFSGFAPISNGNLFETRVEINSRADIAKMFLSNQDTYISYNEEIKNMLTQYNINSYYLLLLHSLYWANIFKYNSNDKNVKQMVKKIIRDAFINGKSGLYYNDRINKTYPIHIVEIEKNNYQEIIRVKYVVFENMFSSESLKQQETGEYISAPLIIEGDDLKNLAIFSWTTMELSAWIVYFPFVKFHNVLLQVLINHSFIFNKKYIHLVNNKFAIKDELKAFFEPTNPILTQLNGTELYNRFKIIENIDKLNASDFIEYYKECLGAFYSIYGKRNNNDYKQERNLVDEIKLTGENIDIIEKEYKDCFEYFVEQANKLPNIKITIEEEKEGEENDIKRDINTNKHFGNIK